MTVKILCVGDVVGSPGRNALREALAQLVPDRAIDCVIANAENVAGGSGLTAALYEKLLRDGVNVVTLGDHIYRRRDIIPLLESSPYVVKPANYPTGAPGREYALYDTQAGPRVAVISLMGRLYMKPPVNCPFAAVDRVLAALPQDVRIVVVDIHAEATSEKIALGWHLDGRVSVVFGTHTHVPTADERVLPAGTAYITDLGMTGPYDSVLGRDKHCVIRALRTGVPNRFEVAEGDVRVSGMLATVDSTSGKTLAVERIRFDAVGRAVD